MKGGRKVFAPNLRIHHITSSNLTQGEFLQRNSSEGEVNVLEDPVER